MGTKKIGQQKNKYSRNALIVTFCDFLSNFLKKYGQKQC